MRHVHRARIQNLANSPIPIGSPSLSHINLTRKMDTNWDDYIFDDDNESRDFELQAPDERRLDKERSLSREEEKRQAFLTALENIPNASIESKTITLLINRH